MAQAPMSVPPPADDAGAAPPPGTDAGAPAPDAGGGDEVLVTIAKTADGTYMVYNGDEPEAGGDMDAAPGAGDMAAGAPQGHECSSIGAALKASMDILQKSEGEGGGSAEDAFQAGFKGGSAASPPKADALAQKY